MKSGAKSLFDDCDQLGRKSCNQLGWAVYVWIEPLSVATSEARVRAYVMWPDRGSAAFEAGVAPKGRAVLVGFASDIHLARSHDEKWKFVKQGRTIAF